MEINASPLTKTFPPDGPLSSDDAVALPQGAIAQLGSPEFRTGDAGVGLALLPDGRRFVAGLPDHRIGLFSAETGRLLHVYRGHADAFKGPIGTLSEGQWTRDRLRALAVSSDGRFVWSIGARAWRTDLQTGDATPYKWFDSDALGSWRGAVQNEDALAIFSGGRSVIGGQHAAATRVTVCDLRSGATSTLELPGPERWLWRGNSSASISPDGLRMAFLLRPNNLSKWKESSAWKFFRVVSLDLRTAEVRELAAFAHDEAVLVGHGRNGDLWVIRSRTDTRAGRVQRFEADGSALPERPLAATFLPRITSLQSPVDRYGVVAWTTRTSRRGRYVLATMDSATDDPLPSERQIPIASDGFALPRGSGFVLTRDLHGIVSRGDGRPPPAGHLAPVTAVAVSPDQRWIASADARGGVCCWCAETFELLWTRSMGPRIPYGQRISLFVCTRPMAEAMQVGFSADGTSVFAGFSVPQTVDGVRSWSTQTGEREPTLVTGTDEDSIYEHALLAAGSAFGAFLTLSRRNDPDRAEFTDHTRRFHRLEVRHLSTGEQRGEGVDFPIGASLRAFSADGSTVSWSHGSERHHEVFGEAPGAVHCEGDVDLFTDEVIRPGPPGGLVWLDGGGMGPILTDLDAGSVIVVARSMADGQELWRRELCTWEHALASATGLEQRGGVHQVWSGDRSMVLLFGDWAHAILLDARTGEVLSGVPAQRAESEGLQQAKPMTSAPAELVATCGAVSAAAFFPDARRVVIGGIDGTLFVYELDGGVRAGPALEPDDSDTG